MTHSTKDEQQGGEGLRELPTTITPTTTTGTGTVAAATGTATGTVTCTGTTATGASALFTVKHPVWKAAVEGVLFHLLDAETQVHEEYLRLILASSSQLSTPHIAMYLQVKRRDYRV